MIHAKTKDYIKGFDDLGGTNDFPTEMQERCLGCAEVINYSGNLLDSPTAGGDKTHTSLVANKTVEDRQRTVFMMTRTMMSNLCLLLD